MLWDSSITQQINQAYQLMLDPASQKTPVDNPGVPAGVIQYRLADGTLVSQEEGGGELKMTLFFAGGTVKVEVFCSRCGACGQYLSPDRGRFCSYCGADQGGPAKRPTMERVAMT